MGSFQSRVFKLFLEFIYSGTLDSMSERVNAEEALDLCILAHRFSLPRLVTMCERHISQKTTLENVSGLLKRAHDAKLLQVRDFLLDYCHANYRGFAPRKADL